MDDEPLCPNTRRYWRLNEIAALTMMHKDPAFARSPEEYAEITGNIRRLNDLTAHENRLLARFKRMTGRDLAEEVRQEEKRRRQLALKPLDRPQTNIDRFDLPF